MPMLIKNTDQYLYENKRDIFILEIKNQTGTLWYNDEDQYNKAIEKEQLDWLDAHGVEYARTGPPELLEGWLGHYYVDFAGWDDPKVAEYTEQYENKDGSSLNPEKYRMVALSYEEWVGKGRLAEYEQYLKDMEDPNYEW
jgi:hypothetical protein